MSDRNGIQSQVVDTSSGVGLGGNEFETGAVNVAANSTIKKGTVLKRDGEKFAPLTDSSTETPVGVVPFDIENKGSAAADMSLRAIIFGPVIADLLTIGGQPITTAQRDLIRDHSGIIPIKANDISHTK